MSKQDSNELVLSKSLMQLVEPEQEGEQKIDFEELFFRLLGKWKFILCIALIVGTIFGIAAFCFVVPEYEATSTIYILNRRDSAINMSDLQLGTALTQDFIKVFTMWEVHEQVISNLGLPYTYSEMQSMIRIKNDDGTRMLDITARSTSPVLAAEIANEYARVASAYISQTMSTEEPSIMSVALVPTEAANMGLTKSIVLGFIIGGFIACVIVFIQYFMDDKLKTAEDIRKYTGLANLAIIPVNTTDKAKSRNRGVSKKK